MPPDRRKKRSKGLDAIDVRTERKLSHRKEGREEKSQRKSE